MMSHGPSREWGDLKTQQIMDSISGLQAQVETPEERRRRELEAYLKQGSQISYGPLGPSVSIRDADEARAKGALLDWGVPLNIASPTATIGASFYDGLEKLTGGRSWHPGTGRSPYYPDSILTDVTGGGSIKGTWNY